MRTFRQLLLMLTLTLCGTMLASAYEYFTICFHDGTRSGVFYTNSIDSIRYSTIDLDSTLYSEWKVQEIWIPDSVYRYRLADIDSLSFTNVNVDRVAENMTNVGDLITPYYLNNTSSNDLLSQLAGLSNLDNIERIWADNQTVFVKIKDWGVMSYTYPPKDLPQVNYVQQERQLTLPDKSVKSLTELNGNLPVHNHKEIKKACIAIQVIKDSQKMAHIDLLSQLAYLFKTYGIDVDIVTDFKPSFFKTDIKKYDLVILCTHGSYDGENHWLATREELFTAQKGTKLDKETLYNIAYKHCREKYELEGYSPYDIGIMAVDEVRNGETVMVWYTTVSEQFIAKHHNPKSSNIIFLNTACQSLKGNDYMSRAFHYGGVMLYGGFDETNSISPITYQELCHNLLSGLPLLTAYSELPKELKSQTLDNITANFKALRHHADDAWICISPVKTLDFERKETDNKQTITLNGTIRCYAPKNNYILGFFVSADKDPQASNSKFVRYTSFSDEDTWLNNGRQLDFSAEIPLEELNNDYKYYRAVLYVQNGKDESLCLGDVKELELKQEAYVVFNDGVLTFYYDDKKTEREGTVYDIKKEYTSYSDRPQWVGAGVTKAVFDSSFSDYRPTSTAYWFYGCSKLPAIEGLQNLNTLNVTSMDFMFGYCYELTSLDLSNFDTSNVTSMAYMFIYCSSLTSLDLSNFNTPKVTNMSNMFDACRTLTSLNMRNAILPKDCSYLFEYLSALKEIDLSNANTSNVTDMSGMFDVCSSLTSLDLSNFDTSNVTDMGSMFSDCSSLTSLDLSNFDTSNVTDMGSMFSGCSSLTSLDLSNFNTSNWIDMSFMFSGCSSLTSLDLSNFDTSNVTSMDCMFYNCSSLTSLDVSNFNTSNVIDMTGMFSGCSSLTSLDVSNFDTSNVTNSYWSSDSRGMFYNCSSLTSLDLSNFDTSNWIDMSFMFAGCSSLTSLDLSNFDTSNVTSMAYMFRECGSLTNLNMRNAILANDCSSLFANLSALKEIDLSNANTSNVTSMKAMFAGCSSLTSLDLSNFNTSKVTKMGDTFKEYGMFYNCSSLTSLDLSSFNTSNVIDMTGMFSGCKSLTSLDISNFDMSKADVDNIFVDYFNDSDYCISLTYLNMRNAILPKDCRSLFANLSALKEIDLSNANTSNVTSMKAMFAGCSSLTSLDLSNFNTSKVTKMGDTFKKYGMFYNCSSLTSLDLSSFNTSNVTDMSGMFAGCSSLASLDLSNFDTSNVTDMGCMFSDCSSLTSLDLSNFNTSNVTDMGSMFYDCSSLTTIYADNWKYDSNGRYMFSGCDNLRGGKGTKIGYNLYGYDAYGYPLYYYCSGEGSAAHIDGGKDNPGLFTAK